jgi:uncharacterized membrane protein YedE/YeeE
MPCGITCFFAAVIVVAMVVFTLLSSQDPVIQRFAYELSPELKQIYENIVKERTNIFFTGYLIGVVVAVLFVIFSVNVVKVKFRVSWLICSVVVISFVVNHLYYTLSPKTDYLVNHLKNEHDRVLWAKMYRHMQVYFHLSFAIGLVGVGVFGYALRDLCK